MRSQLNHNNIDSIINRYSKPYSDLYNPLKLRPAPELLPAPAPETTHTPGQSNVIASIMIDSNHLRPRET